MRQPDRSKRTGDALRAGDVHARQGAPGVEGIRTSAIAWLLLSLAVLLLDQVTKWWAMTAIPDDVAIAVVEGWWNWRRSYNPGAAFGLLGGAGGWQRPVLAALALGVSAYLVYSLYRLPRRAWRLAVPYALVIGGALGNAADRLSRGQVVDFIQWYWRDFFWPTFNVADMAIVIGAVAIAANGLMPPKLSQGQAS
ncbi:signal peptidase II [Arenimonas sp. MALMAid1274]|jgi:signal peptidase II|uniref:signal peptidase II n=1 Tax=Arenimonas sp. MALMAid1274 TaxID=3411630 RepID=UPI003BA07395